MTTTTKTKKAAKKTGAAKTPSRQKKNAAEEYTVAIGDLVIVIKGSANGGYIVTCPFDPELITQGRTLDEAVAMAKDAHQTLNDARAKDFSPARKTKAGGKP